MLINCVAYREGKKLADIDVDEISDYLKDADCFVWVALRDATPDELDKMRLEFDLHPLAIEDANHGHQRPKLEEYGDSLFAVPGEGDEEEMYHLSRRHFSLKPSSPHNFA